MSTVKAVFDCDLHDAFQMAVDLPQHRPKERQSDCWLDWSIDIEDPAAIEALTRNNAPAIVFGDVVRLLGITFIVIAVIDAVLTCEK
jgi:hypothetical protein